MSANFYLDHLSRNVTLLNVVQQNKSKCTITEKEVSYISHEQEIIFSVFHFTFCIVAVVGNFSAIFVTIRRKHRYIQKACVISLALSDIITAITISILNLTVFLQGNHLWTLGSFMCKFGPFLQIFGVVCSSISILSIALDRYRSVVQGFKRTYNPRLLYCLLGIGAIWILSGGVSYPMFYLYTFAYISLIDPDPSNEDGCKWASLCIGLNKNKLKNYFIILICTVFLPLLVLFLWFYYKVAQLIWKHRKPISSGVSEAPKSTTVNEPSTSQVRVSQDKTTMNSEAESKLSKRSKNTKVTRKIRTFKIIILLMFIFLILRLPLWIYDVIKNSSMKTKLSLWTVKYICSTLTLLNCALNPLLYTFLNQTVEMILKIFNTIKDFTCEVCCCCISNKEFEEFEYDNSIFGNHQNKKVSARSVSNKSNVKISQVKFDEYPITSNNLLQDLCKQAKNPNKF